MKKIKWLIGSIILLFILSGCKDTKNQVRKLEKKNRAPNDLEDVSKGLQDILKEIETIETILDNTDMEVKKAELEKRKKEEEKEDTIEIKSEDKAKDGAGGEAPKKQEKSGPLDKDEKLLNAWEKVDKTIVEVHDGWNKYEVEGVKKGIAPEHAEKFKISLNGLTKAIENRDVLEIYNYGSQSMGDIGSVIEIYKDEVLGEINKIKSYVYESYIRTLEGEEIEAVKLLNESENEINKIRLKFESNDDKIVVLDTLRISINDMKKSLSEKSIKLTRIKKNIIIKNLEELGR